MRLIRRIGFDRRRFIRGKKIRIRRLIRNFSVGLSRFACFGVLRIQAELLGIAQQYRACRHRRLGSGKVFFLRQTEIKKRNLIFFQRVLGTVREQIVKNLVDGQNEFRKFALFGFVGIASQLGGNRQLAFLGVIGAGDDHSLPGRGHQVLNQPLFILGNIKHSFIHAERALPVFLIHEGQQLGKLGKEFLPVDGVHLRKTRNIRASGSLTILYEEISGMTSYKSALIL